jgi:uncharacterized protein (UPF0371 family)
MAKILGFDNDKYLKEQTEAIRERVENSDRKLYLEFGGKLMFDYHASRVLPGFDPNVKIRLLREFRDFANIILCIYAGDIERRKIRADFGVTYDTDALKLIDDLNDWGIGVSAVVITRFEEQPAAVMFKNKLERRGGIKVYTHLKLKGYPTDIETIVSDEGYGRNEYIKTDKPLVVVTGPGPGSGKLSTCLSQLYHDYKMGKESGYAKFETFPIWSIPLKHPVNVAYEAATADLKDVNMIDPYHLAAYNKTTVNYNRDIEIFPVLERILKKITGKDCVYKSPTDMGVNCAGFGIVNDDAVCEAANQEIIRRYLRYKCEYAMGLTDKETVQRAKLIMDELNLSEEERKVVKFARTIANKYNEKNKNNDIVCGAAIELNNDSIITGKSSSLMSASSSLILNAIKQLAGIPDKIHLLSPMVTESTTRFKKDTLNFKTVGLDLDETLIALCICAATNPTAQLAMDKLKDLRGCEIHMTHIPSPGDEGGLRRLGVNLTSDPDFISKQLYVG